MGAAKHIVIGTMSGTSLDGLDLAAVEFESINGKWNYRITAAESIPYDLDWKSRLNDLIHGSALELATANLELGRYFGKAVAGFAEKYRIKPDLVASHGQTIFHQPESGLTLQIGDGYRIMVESGFPVVSDFRSLDLALGGQGAPLVPVGDKLLFHDFDCCLNLGGFANLSADVQNERIAYDICAVNTVMNHLSRKIGEEFDRGGALAAKGNMIDSWFKELNDLDFYRMPGPKSLGMEWVETNIFPFLGETEHSVEDLLHTYSKHVSFQIGREIRNNVSSELTQKRVLVTGGGAFNNYLIENLRQFLGADYQVVVPEAQIVEFKEALIFAFLGLLRWKNQVNVLRSVTGAKYSHSGGTIINNLIVH